MTGWNAFGFALLISSLLPSHVASAECRNPVTKFDPNFHTTITNTPAALNFQALHKDNILNVIYENGIPENPYTHLVTSNFNDFTNITKVTVFPPYSSLLFVIYDDDNSANFTNANSSTLIAAYQVLPNNVQNLVFSPNTDPWNDPWQPKCRDAKCFNISLSNAVSINWNEDLRRWIGEDTGSKMYSSPNLRNWTVFSTQSVASYSEQHEELFPISLTGNSSIVKWVLIVDGRSGYPSAKPSYYLGNIRPLGYVKEYSSAYVMDNVPDSRYYSIAHDGNTVKDEKILVGSITMKNYAVPTSIPIQWSDILLTPRKVTLKSFPDRYYIVQTPLGDFESRTKASHLYNDIAIEPGCNPLTCLKTISFRISAEIHLNTATRVGFLVRKSASQATEIGYDKYSGFYVDRRNSGFPVGANLDTTCHYSQKYYANGLVSNGTVRILILVDVSLVEVFCDDGRFVFSFLIFSNRESDTIELFAIGGTAIAKHVAIHVFD